MSNKESPRDNVGMSEDLMLKPEDEQEAKNGKPSNEEEPVEEDEYNWSKYSDISDLKKPQSVTELPSGLFKKTEEGSYPVAHRDHSKSNSSCSDLESPHENNSFQNEVVSNYLDCGLDNFHLKIIKRNVEK